MQILEVQSVSFSVKHQTLAKKQKPKKFKFVVTAVTLNPDQSPLKKKKKKKKKARINLSQTKNSVTLQSHWSILSILLPLPAIRTQPGQRCVHTTFFATKVFKYCRHPGVRRYWFDFATTWLKPSSTPGVYERHGFRSVKVNISAHSAFIIRILWWADLRYFWIMNQNAYFTSWNAYLQNKLDKYDFILQKIKYLLPK